MAYKLTNEDLANIHKMIDNGTNYDSAEKFVKQQKAYNLIGHPTSAKEDSEKLKYIYGRKDSIVYEDVELNDKQKKMLEDPEFKKIYEEESNKEINEAEENYIIGDNYLFSKSLIGNKERTQIPYQLINETTLNKKFKNLSPKEQQDIFKNLLIQQKKLDDDFFISKKDKYDSVFNRLSKGITGHTVSIINQKDMDSFPINAKSLSTGKIYRTKNDIYKETDLEKQKYVNKPKKISKEKQLPVEYFCNNKKKGSCATAAKAAAESDVKGLPIFDLTHEQIETILRPEVNKVENDNLKNFIIKPFYESLKKDGERNFLNDVGTYGTPSQFKMPLSDYKYEVPLREIMRALPNTGFFYEIPGHAMYVNKQGINGTIGNPSKYKDSSFIWDVNNMMYNKKYNKYWQTNSIANANVNEKNITDPIDKNNWELLKEIFYKKYPDYVSAHWLTEDDKIIKEVEKQPSNELIDNHQQYLNNLYKNQEKQIIKYYNLKDTIFEEIEDEEDEIEEEEDDSESINSYKKTIKELNNK